MFINKIISRRSETSEETADAPECLKKLIDKIAKDEAIKDYQAEYKAFSTEGANHMGSLYLIDIKRGNQELNLFGKIANSPLKIRAMINAHAMYEREVFAYTTLATTFNSLETKYSVPANEQLNVAKYYGSDLTDQKEVIVIDNLIKKGYILHDRFKSIDWDFAKAALDQLAKFHALSYALKFHEPSKFDQLIKSKSNVMFIQQEEAKVAYQSFYQGLLKSAVKAVSDNEDHALATVNKFRQTLQEGWLDYFVPDDYSVMAHCDFRSSNIMVKYEGAAIKSMIPVDYQNISYGPPVNDLIYFLFTSTDQQFRSLYYESYIEHYYDSLSRALKRFALNVDIVYPRSVFDKHLQEKLPFGLSVAITVLPFVVGIPEEVPKMENIPENISSGSELFNDRFRGVIVDLLKFKAL